MTAQDAPTQPIEAWCQDCDQPATRSMTTTRGRRDLCDDHYATLNWKLTSPACNTAAGRKGATR